LNYQEGGCHFSREIYSLKVLTDIVLRTCLVIFIAAANGHHKDKLCRGLHIVHFWIFLVNIQINSLKTGWRPPIGNYWVKYMVFFMTNNKKYILATNNHNVCKKVAESNK